MSAQTSLRYELIGPNKPVNSALASQQERIKYDEVMADRDIEMKEDAKVRFRSQWTEKLAGKAAFKQGKANVIRLNAECAHAVKATVMVRRAQLKELLEQEYRMYEKELNTQGKAFYIKRE